MEILYVELKVWYKKKFVNNKFLISKWNLHKKSLFLSSFNLKNENEMWGSKIGFKSWCRWGYLKNRRLG